MGNVGMPGSASAGDAGCQCIIGIAMGGCRVVSPSPVPVPYRAHRSGKRGLSLQRCLKTEQVLRQHTDQAAARAVDVRDQRQ